MSFTDGIENDANGVDPNVIGLLRMRPARVFPNSKQTKKGDRSALAH